MPFVEDPAHLSKTRLKSDLIAHNVALPPAASKKEVYVALHLKHIGQKNAANFSSDEDDCVEDVTDPEDADMPVPSSLTDDDLKVALLKRGVKAGPIVATTRALYERKLQKVLQSDRHKRRTETQKAVLYSDSEEEENREEDEESRLEKEMRDQPDKTRQESSQRACPPRNTESSSNWNSWNVLKSSEWSQSHCSQIRTSSADHHTGLGSRVLPRSKSVMSNDGASVSSQSFSITQMVEEMENRSSLSITDSESEVKGSNVQENQSQSSRLSQEPARDTFKDILPESKTERTGIYVTCRRPIKGAAQRPVQYAYPDSPASPTTQRRREVERHLVPIHIRILVFLIVVCVLYLLYVNVEDSQGYWSDSDERLLL